MRNADIAIAVAALAVSVVVLVGAREYPYWARTAPGTGFMPTLLGLFGLVLGAALLVNALRRPSAAGLDLPERPIAVRVAGAAGGLVVIVLLTPYLGLLVGQALFMLVVLIGLLGRRLVPSLVATGLTGGLIYLVFLRWLRVPLPIGPLGF